MAQPVPLTRLFAFPFLLLGVRKSEAGEASPKDSLDHARLDSVHGV